MLGLRPSQIPTLHSHHWIRFRSFSALIRLQELKMSEEVGLQLIDTFWKRLYIRQGVDVKEVIEKLVGSGVPRQMAVDNIKKLERGENIVYPAECRFIRNYSLNKR